MPNAFNSLARVTKSYILAANAPIGVDVLIGKIVKTNESNQHLKRGRSIGSKDKILEKEKGTNGYGGNYFRRALRHKKWYNHRGGLNNWNNENEVISISYVSIKKSENKIILWWTILMIIMLLKWCNKVSILNQNLLMNVDEEMISQNERMQFKRNWLHLKNVKFFNQ